MPYHIVTAAGDTCGNCGRELAVGERIIVTPIGGGWATSCLPCLPVVTWHVEAWMSGSEYVDDVDRMPDWSGKVRARSDYRAQLAGERRAMRAAWANGFDPGDTQDVAVSGPMEHASDPETITKHRPGTE